MTPDLSFQTQLDLALRLTVGLVLGAIIGFERELQRQPAGFRTHSLVALGAALFTVVSAFGFSGDLVDPTRIAAQIVSGIGFIGAGTILQYRGNIRGLTTAASLWSVAAIGTAAGAGLYSVAIVGTVLILVVLSILDRVEALTHRRLRLPPKDEVPRRRRDDVQDDGMSRDLLP
ncbi:MAG: MgtC/SapB family protein [Chloroflexota bacterium]